MNRQSRWGFTLVEMMVVIAIIIILVTTLIFFLGPVIKRKGYETRIRSDLHQCIAAINLYMADNSDKYPNYMNSLKKAGYQIPRETEELSNTPKPPELDYFLTYNYVCRLVEERRPITMKFDPEKNALVKAHFYVRSNGKRRKTIYYGPGQGFAESPNAEEINLNLGGFLDGRVDWVSSIDLWEDEYAYYSGGVLLE